MQKLESFAFVFIEISLFYTTVNQDEREFATDIVPNTRSINGPRDLLRQAFIWAIYWALPRTSAVFGAAVLLGGSSAAS